MIDRVAETKEGEKKKKEGSRSLRFKRVIGQAGGGTGKRGSGRGPSIAPLWKNSKISHKKKKKKKGERGGRAVAFSKATSCPGKRKKEKPDRLKSRLCLYYTY